MFWILGILAGICITSWILSYYCVNWTLEFVAFISGAALVSVLFVWGVTHIESISDYAYMEEYLQEHDSGHAISSAHFLELYTKYKRENRYWVGRQFNAKPSSVLEELFRKGYILQMTFE